MAKLREQPKNREIAIRSRNIARMIDGRIYVCKGGTYLVVGKPKFNRLLHCLQSIDQVPQPGKEPGPIQLGFESAQIIPVTKELLADFGRALQKWRKVIADKNLRKPKKSSTREELACWEEETVFLGERLDCLYAQLNTFVDDSYQRTQYIPADAFHLDVSQVVRSTLPSKHVPEVWQFYGLIVGWLSGSAMLTRFLSAIEPILISTHKQKKAEIARHLHELFTLCLNDIGEPAVSSYNRSLSREVRNRLDQVPQDSLMMIGLQPPSRPHDLVDYLTQSINKCDELLKGIERLTHREQIAGIAALCATDACIVPIPSCLIENRIDSENLNPLLAALAKESSKDGYDLLFKEFNAIGNSIGPRLISSIPNILLSGANGEDSAWLLKHGDWGSIRAFARQKLSPVSIKRFIEQMQTTGGKCTNEEIEQVLEAIGNSGDLSVVNSFFTWLNHIPRIHLNKNVAQGIWHSFLGALVFGDLGHRPKALLDRWSNPPKKRYKMPGVNSEKVDPELQKWLNRLAFYQNLAGREPALTKSLVKYLHTDDREENELNYLRQKEIDGTLTEETENRLRKLAARSKDRMASDEKVLRQVKEVCAHTALEAINIVVQNETDKQWRQFSTAGPDINLKSNEKLAILRWAQALVVSSKKRLQELLSAWDKHGYGYRKALEANTVWLSNVSDRGINLSGWFSPQPFAFPVGAKTARLEVARDPFHVFLMGNYFDTCLNLRDGENRDAVLANAYEANKSVLLALDEKDNVIGRKLVGINSKSEIVGFETYVSLNDEDERNVLRDQMNAYCGAWAKKCGFSLSNISTPEKLTDLFWYDDGLEAWPSTAHAAWQTGTIQRSSTEMKFTLTSTLAEFAEKHWGECRSLLESVSLWPPSEGDKPQGLIQKTPELIEELLALIAEEKKDRELLMLLRQSVATNGGILRTLKTLATIEGQAAIPELINALGYRIPSIKEKIGGLLADLGSRAAIDRLAIMVFIDEWPSILELLFAAHRYPEAAKAVAEFLLRERYWYCPPDNLLLLIYLIRETIGESLKDKLFWRIFLHSNRCSLDMLFVPEQLTAYLAQWLPPLQNPEKVVKLKNLEKLWNSHDIDETIPDMIIDIRLGIVCWCLKNPCSASILFLRRYFNIDDSALLGLAILGGKQFERQIEKAYEGNPERPATIMSILHIKGVGEALKFFETVKPRLHMNEDLLHSVISLYQAYENLDWKTIGDILIEIKGHEIKTCLPWLIWNLWRRLEYPSEAVDIGQIAPGKSARAVWDSGVYVFGVIMELALRMKRSDKTSAIRYRQIIHALLGEANIGAIYAEFRLWLDVLSGHRLYTEDAMGIASADLHFNYDIAYSHAYDLFFDNNGKRRPHTRFKWDDYEAPTILPFSLTEADRLAELIVEQAGSTGPNRRFHFQPATEIEKRLVQRHLEKRNK